MQPATVLIPDILRLHGQWRASQPAVIASEGTWTWREFDRVTNQVANGLFALGAKPGDRIGLVMGNRRAAIGAIFGILKAGCVCVPLNLSVTGDAMAAMLRDAGARAIVATADEAPRIEALKSNLPDLMAGALIGHCLDSETLPPGWQDFDRWVAAQSAAVPAVTIDPDAPCNIIYSSGTTGTPKGITHTHARRLAWANDVGIALRYHSAVRTLATIGLYSNISWVAMLCTFTAGGTLYVHRGFDAGKVLAEIAASKITHMAMVPVQYQRMAEHPAFSVTQKQSLQSVMSCGSALPAQLKRHLMDSLPCGVIELYGLTEGIITTLDPEDAEGRLASVGRPIAGTDLRLIGEDGRDVAPGTPGEIIGQCRYVMAGYWNNPEATRAATFIGEDGSEWLRTGDIGRIDADGFLYLVDRRKDMIISGGQNIYPADIETVLITHRDVAECAVIGVPSEKWGETPLAVIVPRTGANADIGEIINFVNARVGRQQRISGAVFAAALPRNPNGKVLKRELRLRYANGI